MPGKPGSSKVTIAKRRLRVRHWLTLRATLDQVLQQLKTEGYAISLATLERDMAAVRKDDLQRLYAQGQSEFVSEYEMIQASIKDEIRALKGMAADENMKPSDRITASGKIVEAETILADLLAYGPTILSVRRALGKANPNGGSTTEDRSDR